MLSGGGARGAYEAGALSNLLPRMAALGLDFDILCATSVGALNACALAATAHYPGMGGARLRAAIMRRAWETIEADKIFNTRFFRALFLFPLHLANVRGPHPEALVQGSEPFFRRVKRAVTPKPYYFPGLFDTSPLERTLRAGALIDWAQLRENIGRGRPLALALSATAVGSGETVCFTQGQGVSRARRLPDEHLTLQPVEMGPHHALASAAIPFLFPPVQIPMEDGHTAMFVDGGVRMNTPLLPALILGADSILALGLQAPAGVQPATSSAGFDVVPVMGKILNAFFLDRVRTDFDRLQIMNKLISLARPDALEAINSDRRARGKDPLRDIRAVELSPSRDIGELTAELWDVNPELHRPPWRWMFDARGLHGSAFGDLMSYIFFHPAFARALLDLGARDAARRLTEANLRWLGGLPGGEEPVEPSPERPTEPREPRAAP